MYAGHSSVRFDFAVAVLRGTNRETGFIIGVFTTPTKNRADTALTRCLLMHFSDDDFFAFGLKI